MDDRLRAQKLDELDRLLNDPDVPMDPTRVWSLLAELSGRDLPDVPISTSRVSRTSAK